MKYNFSVEVETTADCDGFFSGHHPDWIMHTLQRGMEHSLRTTFHVPNVPYPLRAVDVRPVKPQAAGAAVVQ